MCLWFVCVHVPVVLSGRQKIEQLLGGGGGERRALSERLLHKQPSQSQHGVWPSGKAFGW